MAISKIKGSAIQDATIPEGKLEDEAGSFRMILDGSDGSATDAGDFLLLDATASSTNVGEQFLFEPATDDGSAVLSSEAPLVVSTVAGQNGANATAITIDSTGRVLMPARPAFHARHVAAGGVGVQGIIVFNEADFDVGGNYNTANGRFTAPVSGIYYFAFDALVSENSSGGILADGSAVYVNFYKNGALTAAGQRSYARITGGAQYNTIYRTETMQLSAGDYVQLNVTTKFIYNDASGNYCPTFQGFLVG